MLWLILPRSSVRQTLSMLLVSSTGRPDYGRAGPSLFCLDAPQAGPVIIGLLPAWGFCICANVEFTRELINNRIYSGLS